MCHGRCSARASPAAGRLGPARHHRARASLKDTPAALITRERTYAMPRAMAPSGPSDRALRPHREPEQQAAQSPSDAGQSTPPQPATVTQTVRDPEPPEPAAAAEQRPPSSAVSKYVPKKVQVPRSAKVKGVPGRPATKMPDWGGLTLLQHANPPRHRLCPVICSADKHADSVCGPVVARNCGWFPFDPAPVLEWLANKGRTLDNPDGMTVSGQSATTAAAASADGPQSESARRERRKQASATWKAKEALHARMEERLTDCVLRGDRWIHDTILRIVACQ
eukprot:COSAG06_NODE_412_length_16042_cov_52.419934_5_plen_280_part_00